MCIGLMTNLIFDQISLISPLISNCLPALQFSRKFPIQKKFEGTLGKNKKFEGFF